MYHRAALLHPDRHRDPALKPAADARFAALQRAYEVLSDPAKRAIYDQFGESGLKTQWEVSIKGKTPAEVCQVVRRRDESGSTAPDHDLLSPCRGQLRAEFERLNRQQLEQNVENLVKSKGELTVVSDARVLFLSDAELERLGGPEKLALVQRLQTVQQRQIFLKHTFTTPISPSTALVATTQVLARQGQGAGNLLLKLQHNPSSKLSLELGTTVLRPRALTFKSTYSPSADTFARVEVPFRSVAQPPKFTCTLGRLVYPNTTGTITFRSGAWALGPWGSDLLQPYSDSALSVGLNHASGWGLEATNTVFVKQVAVSYGRTVLGGVRLELAGVVTNVGATSVSISADRRITENVKAGMGLEVAASGAMTVKLRCALLFSCPPHGTRWASTHRSDAPCASAGSQLQPIRAADQPPHYRRIVL